MKKLLIALLLVLPTLALAEPRLWQPSTKVRLTAPSSGASTATSLEGKYSYTFFASGELTCLCIGQTTCDNTAVKGGICIQQGAAVDFNISGTQAISVWSPTGLGIAEIMGWRKP